MLICLDIYFNFLDTICKNSHNFFIIIIKNHIFFSKYYQLDIFIFIILKLIIKLIMMLLIRAIGLNPFELELSNRALKFEQVQALPRLYRRLWFAAINSP